MAHDFDDDGEGWGEQSRFAAHLDRGWTQLERGEVQTARAAAQHALEARPDAPEALLLMGAVAVAEGRLDEAEDLFQRATEIDPEYPEPYVELAHMLVFHAQRPRDAVDVVDSALELDTLTPIERLDLGVLGLEAAIVAGDARLAKARVRALEGLADLRDLLDAQSIRASDEDDEERETLLRLHGFVEPDELDDPEADEVEAPDDEELAETFHRALGVVLRLARVLVDLGDAENAADWLRAAVARAPDDAEGWYLLGDVELMLGNPKAAALAGVQTLRIDLRASLPAWVPSPATIQRRTLDLLGTVEHPQVRGADAHGGTDVLVIVQECPSPELLVEGVDPRVPLMSLFGRTSRGEQTVLTGIAVYRRNLAQQSASQEEFWANLRAELLDELAAALPTLDSETEPTSARSTKSKPSRAPKAPRGRADGGRADGGHADGGRADAPSAGDAAASEGRAEGTAPSGVSRRSRTDADEATSSGSVDATSPDEREGGSKKVSRRRKTPRLLS